MASAHMILLAVGVNCLKFILASSPYSTILGQFDVEPLSTITDTELRQFNPDGMMSELNRCVYPSDCREVQKCDHHRSGVYRIFPFGVGKGILVYCDMVTDGGGWLVFLRRQDGTVDFYRNWQNYKHGFGNLYEEFWLGLDKIHILSTIRRTELLVNLGRFVGETGWAKYRRFRVSDESAKYMLLVEAFTGNIGDAMANQNGMMFSTHDKDYDEHSQDGNCASEHRGAWRYKSCSHSHLNAVYKLRGEVSPYTHPSWYQWKKNDEVLQFVEMKMRPVE